tara:strand:- start:1275 stop:1670 length:396 start_codon:yes stop_codon:yes gene_type:complete
MINYAKGYGCLEGHLSMLTDTLEVKMLCEHNGEVVIPKEVTEELKAMIAKMLKHSEEVGNQPSEFMDIPEAFNEVAKHNAEDDADDDRDFYLKEYDASDPTCNLPVPDEDEEEDELYLYDPRVNQSYRDII